MVVRYVKNPVFLSVIILVFCFYSGKLKVRGQNGINTVIPQDKIRIISGKIISSPVKSGSGKNYVCKIQLDSSSDLSIKASARGICSLFIPSEAVEAFFPGKLYSKAKGENQYLYDAGAFYTFKGKFYQENFMAEKCINCFWKNNLSGKLDFIRAKSRLQFKRLMYRWKNAGGLLLALLCGEREYTEKSISDSFKNAGLSHILALSGMHLSMFSAIALFIGNRIGRKRLSFIIRITVLIFFVWFAGFSPSLLRAFICAMLVIFSLLADVNNIDMIMILCFSFLLQSVIRPEDIYNYAFMLSYGALFGILFTNKFFFLFFNLFLPQYFASSLSSSSGAQLFTLPMSLKFFSSYSPIGIIATSIVSPLVTIFIYSGLLLIIISLIFPSLVDYSGILLNFEYTVLNKIVSFFAKAPRISI